jgi:murein DD-endopeptidase MepM/ murein hydrolase activator NlpD
MRFVWPVPESGVPDELPYGYTFAAPRSTTDPPHPHGGIDLGKMGQPVFASADGTVSFSGQSSGLGGIMVYIDHEGGWQTRYMHLQEKGRPKKGDFVSQGDQIGYVGLTGITNSAAHVHFEILQDGTRVDPWPILIEGSQVIEEESRSTVIFGLAVVGAIGYLGWFLWKRMKK